MAITQRIKSLIEAPNPRGLSSSQLFVENEDLKPVESARRLWRGWNFVTFWIAYVILQLSQCPRMNGLRRSLKA